MSSWDRKLIDRPNYRIILSINQMLLPHRSHPEVLNTALAAAAAAQANRPVNDDTMPPFQEHGEGSPFRPLDPGEPNA
jgi:hypothetical protein